MPTYETLPRFTTDLNRLTPEQRRCFRHAVKAFVHDLRTGGASAPASAKRAGSRNLAGV